MSDWFYSELRERLLLTLEEGPRGRPVAHHGCVSLSTSISSVREENQDRAILLEIRSDRFGPARLAVVCDGMGGLQRGGDAAAEALATFVASFASLIQAREDERLLYSLNRANWAVFDKFNGRSGTTLTALLMTKKGHWSIHCGDSRLYRIDRNGRANLVTRDDTLQNAINEHAGKVSEDDLDNRLIQFVGVGEALEPHLDFYGHNNFDRWLLTTDGAHAIGRTSLEGIHRNAKNSTDFLRKIMYVADAVGTSDNATAIYVGANDLTSSSRPGLFFSVYTPKDGFEIWLPRTAAKDLVANVDRDWRHKWRRPVEHSEDELEELPRGRGFRKDQEVLFDDGEPDS
ncbi:MAG: protein phosphatase 2C domain-containing protein [Erythrobacter sp.]|uniref:PP2C family protein-serine/threonine phosphatase n=1 Tax=Erythrobacter sp. TaxID=1042 RepID=UPI003297AD90